MFHLAFTSCQSIRGVSSCLFPNTRVHTRDLKLDILQAGMPVGAC